MAPAAKRALAGIALAQGAPAGWMLIRLAGGRSPLDELAASPGLYLYLGLATTVAFGFFGHVLGTFEERLGEANRALERLTRTDLLTRLENARAVAEAMPRLVSFARRSGTPLSVIALDLDRFRLVNERHGAVEADDVLRRVGRLLVEGRRQEDIVARTGADDFVVVLPGIARCGAERAAVRMLDAVRRFKGVADGVDVTVTASAGVASFERIDDQRSLLRRAEAALEEAKRTGGDRIVAIASEAAPAGDIL